MSPWTAKTFLKHNKKLSKMAAQRAADIANAVLRETHNEGLAVKVANTRVKGKSRKRG